MIFCQCLNMSKDRKVVTRFLKPLLEKAAVPEWGRLNRRVKQKYLLFIHLLTQEELFKMSGHVFPCSLLCSFFTTVEILPLTGTQLHSCAGAPPVFERTKQLLLFKQMSSPALPPPRLVLSPAVVLTPLWQSWGRSDLKADLFLPTKLPNCSLRSCINWYQFQ